MTAGDQENYYDDDDPKLENLAPGQDMEDLLANIADDSIPQKRGSSYSVV